MHRLLISIELSQCENSDVVLYSKDNSYVLSHAPRQLERSEVDGAELSMYIARIHESRRGD